MGVINVVKSYKVAVMPGDGVGPEVTREAVKVLKATGLTLEFLNCNVGGKAYIETGVPLPPEAKESLGSGRLMIAVKARMSDDDFLKLGLIDWR